MSTDTDFKTVTAAFVEALSNYGAGEMHRPVDKAIAAALEPLSGSRKLALEMSIRAKAARRITESPDDASVRRALVALGSARLPMIAPGLRMPLLGDVFQTTPSDRERPPFRFSVPGQDGKPVVTTVTQQTLRERQLRMRVAEPDINGLGDPLTSAQARRALAKQYAHWGIVDEASAERAINSHVRSLGTAKVLADRKPTTYRVEYTGMYCQRESGDRLGRWLDSDEPYFIFASTLGYSGESWTQNTGIYDVDDGIDSTDNWGAIPSPFFVAGKNGGGDCWPAFRLRGAGDGT